MENILKQFIIGTLVSIVPYIYLGIPHVDKGPIKPIPFEYLILIIPVYWGLVNVFVVSVMPHFISSEAARYLLGGAIFSFILSLIGKFGLHIPEQLFNNAAPYVHLIAVILYSLVFYVGLRNLNKLFGID